MKFWKVVTVLAVVLGGLALYGELFGGKSPAPVSRQHVVVTSVDEYNVLQKTRAMDTPMLMERQVGDTCVFYQARSALHSLGMPDLDKDAYTKATGKYENAAFAKGLIEAGVTPSNYVGGLPGVGYSVISLLTGNGWHWFGEDDAFRLLEDSVDAGKVVLVSLDSKPLHEALSQELHIDPPTSKGGSHAVRVLGFHRTASKAIDEVYLYDTAVGQVSSLRYAIAYSALKEAYGSWQFYNRMNRGVYVSEQPVFPEIDKRF